MMQALEMLKGFECENIVKVINFWLSEDGNYFVYITEVHHLTLTLTLTQSLTPTMTGTVNAALTLTVTPIRCSPLVH